MTEIADASRCRWCGGRLPQVRRGRRRRYCRDSHRQRAYEARRMGWRMGLDSGEAVVSAETVAALSDRLVQLEAALEDVERDLRRERGDSAYREAFHHLYAAAAGLRGVQLRVRALARSRDA